MSRAPIARLTRAGWLILGVIWTTTTTAQTAEELIVSKHVMIRSRLEPTEPVYVGQPVRLWVEVMTRTWFLEAPRYPATIEVPKAIVIPPESFGVNSIERIGGETYAVQGRYFTIFPQTTGEFAVPSVAVTLVVARDDASRSPNIDLRTEPTAIEAALPSGVEGRGLVLSTPGLSVSEQYSRSTEELRVGESFERQVTMSIESSVAMLLPPMEFAATEGIAIYPARPEVTDQRNRGSMSGTRVDAATYVMETEGSFVLPAVMIPWWNLRTSQLEQEVLPEVEFTVEANPDLAAEHLGEPEIEEAEVVEDHVNKEEEAVDWRVILVGVVSLVILLLLLRRIRWRLGSNEAAQRPEVLEAKLFDQFDKMARSGDPRAAYAAFVAWLDHLFPDEVPVSSGELLNRAADQNLTQQYDALVQELYGGGSVEAKSSWSGTQFSQAVRRGRRVFLRGEARQEGMDDPLPPLNPVAKTDRDSIVRNSLLRSCS